MEWKYQEPQAWHWHPIVKGLAGGGAVVVAVQIVIFFLMPTAWAAVEISVTDRITINMGDLLSWGQFILGVAGFWLIYKKAASAEANSLRAVLQTDGVLEKVAALSKREGKAEEKLAGEAKAETLARGQEEGRRSSGQASTIDPEILAAAAASAATAAAAAEVAAPPIVKQVVPPAVEEAVKAEFAKERSAKEAEKP